MCVALAALDAKVHVTGPSGERVIAFADFHRLPGDTPQRDTNLQPTRSSRLSSFRRKASHANYSYLKIRDRLSYAFALVSVAAGARTRRRRDQEGAARAWRRRAQAVARSGCGSARCADSEPTWPRSRVPPTCCCATPKAIAHNDFKIDLARRAIVRALTQAARGNAPIAIQQEDRVNVAMATLHRHRYISHRRQAPRSPARPNMPASSTSPTLLYG